MIHVGFDLHKRYITACALDADGVIVAEARRLSTEWSAIAAWLAPLPAPVTVVLEATVFWMWLEAQLTAAGYQVVVANAAQVKLIWHARAKTDPIDARKLAELSRVNLLPRIWIPDSATRARRQLLRGRAFLVRQRTVLKNRVHAHLLAENCQCPVLGVFTKSGRAWLARVVLSPVARLQIDLLLASLDLLTLHVQRLDREIARAVARNTECDRLQTIPGVGPFSALLLQAEIGPITRFRSAHELAAYAGLVPSTQSSGGKTHHGRVAHGSPWLKWILVEIVQTLKPIAGPVGGHYRRLLKAKGKQKATVAAARKLCTYVYWMCRQELTYPEWLRQHDHVEVRPRLMLGPTA